MLKPTNVRAKKLLVAAVGVASVSYLACSSSSSTPGTVEDASANSPDAFMSSGNLVAPLPDGSVGDAFMSSGNLVAPMPEASPDAPADAVSDAKRDAFIITGNLIAPLPDAGRD